MGIRVRDIVPGLDHDELMKIKKDLDAGGVHLKKLVDKEIDKKEKEHEVYCSTCLGKIDPSNPNTYTLIFGPHDFRKKATFCGMDCLQYFLENLRKEKR